MAKLSDYFNFQYSSAARTHYSIQMLDDDHNLINGFIRKTDGESLFAELKDGREHAVMVELAFDASAPSGSDVVRIDKFVGKGWRALAEETDK